MPQHIFVSQLVTKQISKQRGGVWKQILVSPATVLSQIQIQSFKASLKLHDVQVVELNGNVRSLFELQNQMISMNSSTTSNSLSDLGPIVAINIRAESFRGLADLNLLVNSEASIRLKLRSLRPAQPVVPQPVPQAVSQRILCQINTGVGQTIPGGVFGDACMAAHSAQVTCEMHFNGVVTSDSRCAVRQPNGLSYGVCADEYNRNIDIRRCQNVY
jgi:hypothetical protein